MHMHIHCMCIIVTVVYVIHVFLCIVMHTCRVLFRLYWFITKALYSAGHVSLLTCINIVSYLPFNVMLIALYLMQVYWFYFIVKLLIKVGKERGRSL